MIFWKKKKQKKILIQFLKFCCVGGIGTIIHFVILVFLIKYETLLLTPVLATSLAFLLATMSNFLLNKRWTFKQKKKIDGQFLRYLFVALIGWAMSVGIMYFLVNLKTFDYRFSQAFAIFVVVFWNFWGSKIFVFSDRRLSAKKFNLNDFNFKHDLSIIIPAYNEKNRIKKTLRAVRDYLKNKKLTAEILVVDDGSSDGTSEAILKFQEFSSLKLIKQKKNIGKGGAIQEGFKNACGKYTLFLDADHSTKIIEFDKFLPSLKKTPIVIGSRYIKASNQSQRQNLARRILSRTSNKLIRNLLKMGIIDTQCGFKAFHTPVSQFLAKRQKIKRFAFDMELLAIASLHRIPVKEIGIEWENNEETSVNFFRDSYYSLRDLIKIKLNLWKGKYN